MPSPCPRQVSLAAMLALACGCVSPQEGSGKQAETPKRLSAAEFREVLEQGTITPVISLDGEDVFQDAVDAQIGDLRDPDAVLAELEGEILAAPGAVSIPPPIEDNPYLVFGERIKVYPDGTITKPYPLRVGTGSKMKSLIESYGNFPLWDESQGPVSSPTTVKIENLENWDVEIYQNLREADPSKHQEKTQNLADWLVVTTGFDLLLEVEGFINLFAAGVPQIEIEAKIVEITFTDALDLGVETSLTWPGKTLVDSFGNETPNLSNPVGGVLALSAVQDGVSFDATIQALATRDNVSIISQPKIAVREGGRADILNTTRTPFIEVTTLNPSGGANAKLSYIETGVKLYVVPRVVGTQTVALNIDIEASQQSGDQVTFVSGTEPISVPIVSTRGAHTVVYLQPGQAVVLGGLISERTVERIRKTPLLGDIPLVKYLFSSKSSVKEQTNVLFFIRPRILRGAELNREF